MELKHKYKKVGNKVIFGVCSKELRSEWVNIIKQQVVTGATVRLTLAQRTFMETILLTLRDGFAREKYFADRKHLIPESKYSSPIAVNFTASLPINEVSTRDKDGSIDSCINIQADGSANAHMQDRISADDVNIASNDPLNDYSTRMLITLAETVEKDTNEESLASALA